MRAVLCVDDDVVRAGLTSMLERHHPVSVVAECDDTDDAVQATARLRPDVTVVGTTSASLRILRLIADTVDLVLLVEGSFPPPMPDDVLTRAIVPMPRTHYDVARLVDLIQHHEVGRPWPPPDTSTVSQQAPWIRMLLLDNQPTVRLAIQTLVQPYENIEVVGNCSTVGEARKVLDSSPVEIVVMELEVLGVKEWEDFCLELRSHRQSPKIFVYSSANSPDYVATAIRAGVDSFVHKGIDCNRLMDAIHRTCVGERVWLVGTEGQEVVDAHTMLTRSGQLTNRERQILVPLLCRHSNDEIANDLCLAVQTVKNHVSSILRKVGVRNRRELFQRLSAETSHLGQPPAHRS